MYASSWDSLFTEYSTCCIMGILNWLRGRNKPDVVMQPSYSVGDLSSIVRELATEYDVVEAYLNVPNVTGVESFHPDRVTLIYRHGKRSDFLELRGFRKAISNVFGQQVIPYASGPNENSYVYASKHWLKIL